MDADTEEDVNKEMLAETFAIEIATWKPEDFNFTDVEKRVLAYLEQYGRLVQESAAKEAEKPHTCNTQYATFERNQDDIVKAIREMPLP